MNTDTRPRPSLYNHSSSAEQSADEKISLLDVGEGASGRLQRGHLAAFVALAGLLVVFGIVVIRVGLRSEPQLRTFPATVTEPAPITGQPAIAPISVATKPSDSEVPLADAAPIVVDGRTDEAGTTTAPVAGLLATTTVQAPPSGSDTNAKQPGPSEDAIMPAKANDLKPAAGNSNTARSGMTVERSAASPHAVTGEASAKPAAKHAPHAVRHQARHRVVLKSKKRADDSDVDLIAALLTRVSHTEKSTAAAHAPASASDYDERRPAARSGAAVTANRDIVVPRQKETLADLVTRCRALGMIEGELCRIRICSGHWGKDPACPAGSGNSPD